MLLGGDPMVDGLDEMQAGLVVVKTGLSGLTFATGRSVPWLCHPDPKKEGSPISNRWCYVFFRLSILRSWPGPFSIFKCTQIEETGRWRIWEEGTWGKGEKTKGKR